MEYFSLANQELFQLLFGWPSASIHQGEEKNKIKVGLNGQMFNWKQGRYIIKSFVRQKIKQINSNSKEAKSRTN